jgi:hypothetical protein
MPMTRSVRAPALVTRSIRASALTAVMRDDEKSPRIGADSGDAR